MNRSTIVAFILLTLITLPLGACAPYQQRGGTAGGAMGGIAGAILDRGNPWRGGVIGAALGAIAGATIADISTQGGQQAVIAGRPVEYRTEDNRGYYYAEPIGPDRHAGCTRIREKIYVDGRLVKKRIKTICRESYERYRHDRYEDEDD